MNINNLIFDLIEEQNVIKTTKTKPIADAIKNRNKLTFYYTGPRKGKESVKSGMRVKVEPVALGLSKKGNLILRAYVQPPSATKTGFAKHGWRTFILGRMNNVQITDEIFNEKRPGYKEGPDGSMTTTYVTTDWTKNPKTKKVDKPKDLSVKSIEPSIEKPVSKIEKPEPEVKPTTEPEVKSTIEPTPEVKPSKEPIQTTQEPNQDYIDKQKELYKSKQTDWVGKQKEVGGNIKPGQGTRERFKKEVEKELPQPKPEEKPSVNPEEDVEDEKLQENLKRIKCLMLL